MRILTRYLLRLHIGPFLFAVTGLTLLLLLDQVSKRFRDLIGKDLHWTVIAEVFVYSVPFILAQTLPMAVLIAVLYVFNRLEGDFEITAIRASGVPLGRLMAPLLLAATVLAGAMTWFNNTVLPDSNHHLQVLLTSIGRKKPTFYLRERAINEVLPSQLYVQPGAIRRETSQMEDVALYDERGGQQSRTIYAEGGTMAFGPDGEDLYLNLVNGTLQERPNERPHGFQRVHFARMIMRVEGVSNQLERDTLSSYRSDREMNIAQMQEEVAKGQDQVRRARIESKAYAVAVTRKLTNFVQPLESGGQPDEAAGAGDVASDTATREAAAAADDPGIGRGADSAAGRPDAPRRAIPGLYDRPGTPPSLMRRDDPQEAADSARAPPAGDGPRADGSAPDTLAAGGGADSAGRQTVDPAAKPQPEQIPADSVATFGKQAAERFQYAADAANQFFSYDERESTGLGQISKFRVEIHKKGSIPAACIVFVLIGAPIAVRYPRAGVALVVGVSLSFFALYYVSLVGGEELADRRFVSSFWAMWAPNVLFGLIGLGALWRATRVTR